MVRFLEGPHWVISVDSPGSRSQHVAHQRGYPENESRGGCRLQPARRACDFVPHLPSSPPVALGFLGVVRVFRHHRPAAPRPEGTQPRAFSGHITAGSLPVPSPHEAVKASFSFSQTPDPTAPSPRLAWGHGSMAVLFLPSLPPPLSWPLRVTWDVPFCCWPRKLARPLHSITRPTTLVSEFPRCRAVLHLPPPAPGSGGLGRMEPFQMGLFRVLVPGRMKHKQHPSPAAQLRTHWPQAQGTQVVRGAGEREPRP